MSEHHLDDDCIFCKIIRGSLFLFVLLLSACQTTMAFDSSKLDVFATEFLRSETSLMETNKAAHLRLYNACLYPPNGDWSGLKGAALGHLFSDSFTIKQYTSPAILSPTKREGILKRFEEMVESDHAVAQYLLAGEILMRSPLGNNAAAAGEMMERSAESGCPAAQTWASFLRHHGFGVLQDRGLAYKWAVLAATAGHPYAKTIRGRYRKLLTPVQRLRAERLVKEWRLNNL